MKPVDATEMRSLRRGRKAGPWVWARRLILGFLFLLILAIVLLWVLRKPIAERALEAWCADRDLTCEAKFTRISADGAVLSGVKITSGRNVPAEAREVVALISWPGLFRPEIEAVSIAGLEMRGTLDPAGLRFYGLERLAAPGAGPPGRAPPIEIRDARIFLDTPFGPAAATLNVSGRLPEAGSASLRLDPARLSLGGAHIAFSEALLTARAADGEVTGDFRLTADTARIGGYSATGFSLASEAVFPMTGQGPALAEWSVRAARLATPEGGATGLRSRGQAGFAIEPGLDFRNLSSALTHAVMEAEFDSAEAAGRSSGAARLDINLDQQGGSVTGPVNLEARDLSGPEGRAGSFRLSGDLQLSPEGSASFDGGAQLVNTALAPDMLAPLRGALRLPEPFAAHGVALDRALNSAASDFDAALGLGLTFREDALSIVSTGPAGLASASGLRVDIDVPDDVAWLSHRGGETRLSGALQLSGGGAPRLAAGIGEARIGGGSLQIRDTSLNLNAWRAGGNTVSAALRSFDLSSEGDAFTASGRGEIGFSGTVAGLELASTRLSGGLSAARDAEGLRVQSDGAPCLAFASGGITLGGLSVPQAAFDICPVDGRFIRQGEPLGGAARLGNPVFPIVFQGGEGEVDLSGALADWSIDDGFSLTLSAEALQMPMTLGENTLTLDAATPEIRVQSGRGPVRFNAQLDDADFGGSLIPAKVTARGFTFDGVSVPAGLDGDVSANGVRITDPGSDPIYQPVIGDFSGRLAGRRLTASGPLRQEAQGFALATASADLDIFDLTGTASVEAQPIIFRPEGVQPAMISRRLVGLFTNARGSFSGAAEFAIDSGNIQGTADLSLLDFGFQTTRLGRVDGVSGDVHFADLMNLTTAPGQVVRIGSVDPGVPLSGGEVVFAFEAGETLQLESVTFPFASGQLALAPMSWKLGGAPERVAVTASGLDLTQLIEVLKLPDLRADGTVSGVFPLEFTPTSVVIQDARLRADEGGGRISYTGEVTDAAAESGPVASMAFNALRDLEYTVLELGLSGDLAGQMRADILLAGRNIRPVPVTPTMTMPSGQAFEFAIGFNLPLGQLISQGMQLADARTVLEVVTELDTDGAPMPR